MYVNKVLLTNKTDFFKHISGIFFVEYEDKIIYIGDGFYTEKKITQVKKDIYFKE